MYINILEKKKQILYQPSDIIIIYYIHVKGNLHHINICNCLKNFLIPIKIKNQMEHLII